MDVVANKYYAYTTRSNLNVYEITCTSLRDVFLLRLARQKQHAIFFFEK